MVQIYFAWRPSVVIVLSRPRYTQKRFKFINYFQGKDLRWVFRGEFSGDNCPRGQFSGGGGGGGNFPGGGGQFSGGGGGQFSGGQLSRGQLSRGQFS